MPGSVWLWRIRLFTIHPFLAIRTTTNPSLGGKMTDQNTLAQPQQISADGQWRWDGAAWVPNTPQTAIPQPPAPQKQKMGLGKKMLIGVGALVLIGVATNMGGGDDTAST